MNKGKGLVFVAVLAIASILLVACGGSTGGTGGGSLTVSAKESGCPSGDAYCWDPATLTVTSGQNVTIVVKNPSGNAAVHSFEITGIAGTKTGDIQPGGEQSITFKAPAAGTYEYHCPVPGHTEAGMHGTLTVQ